MKIVADRMGIDIYEVVDGGGDQAVRLHALLSRTWARRPLHSHRPVLPDLERRANTVCTHRFIELSGEINRAMPEYVIGKLVKALNDRRKSLNGSRILVLGIAYKKDVDDVRESPSVEIMELIQAAGAEVAYSDPHVPRFPEMREHHFDLSSTSLSPDTLAGFDAVRIGHKSHDFRL